MNLAIIKEFKKFRGLLLIGLFQLFFIGFVSAGGSIMKGETILGSNYEYVQAAMPDIKKQGLNFQLYRIFIMDHDSESVSVLLIDKDVPKDFAGRGNPGKIPAFEVEINKLTKKVIRANYSR